MTSRKHRWLGAACSAAGAVAGAVAGDKVLQVSGWGELFVIAAFAGIPGAIGTLIGRRLEQRRA